MFQNYLLIKVRPFDVIPINQTLLDTQSFTEDVVGDVLVLLGEWSFEGRLEVVDATVVVSGAMFPEGRAGEFKEVDQGLVHQGLGNFRFQI